MAAGTTRERTHFDGVLVVGAGLAGLSAALAAAPRKVLVLAPSAPPGATASGWAQGGIAAALGPDDSPELHARDTIAAGAGLVDAEMALLLAREGPAAVRWLAGLGVPFDRDATGEFVLGLEAAHARARVARVRGDQAGAEIMRAVAATAMGAEHVQLRHGTRARALLQDAEGRVRGVLAEDASGLVEITAPAVVLATGGIGGLYAVTTNPPGARGEGLALAAMAGAEIADAEFVQFHPTGMDLGRDPAPLATEALRGEGAMLVDRHGRRFMPEIHEYAELAPRDIVARAVQARIASGDGAFLDMRALGERLPRDFPGVFAACREVGLDPRLQPIPVAPAAHYHMGGIVTDAHGRATLEGLYAAGECARAGIHGTNRLASNSLLEAVVFGRRTGEAAREESERSNPAQSTQAIHDLPADALLRLRKAMSRNAGVVRNAAGLASLLELLDELQAVETRYAPTIAARLIATAALARQESRGAHFRSDHPPKAASGERTPQAAEACS